MIIKCVLFLFIFGCIDAQFFREIDADSCPIPRLEHRRVRMRPRSKLARFSCLPRYELVGNKYATCRDGRWDVPLPVCVRSGCAPSKIVNGLRMISHNGAWEIFFCFPNHELVGSPAIYCDGVRWNASAPTCVDKTSLRRLSCDFEDPALCGWRQDDLHDFDWERRNSKTPSSFVFTGPSFDHTLGKGHYGHYMYIESTSQMENDTARLISPIYDSSLTRDGCFTFSYHMYGKTCGGLRVYQKPDNLTLRKMLDLPEEEKRSYLLFEKWGNLGDTWFNSVTTLKNIATDFQIVIEGIRGKSYTSDIAIDDVAILQGENCTYARRAATTPTTTTSTTPSSVMPDSCVGKCMFEHSELNGTYADINCSCHVSCIRTGECCPDFLDVCLFGPDPVSTETTVYTIGKSSSEEAPQTLKLVAVTTGSTTTTSATTSTTKTTPTTTSTSTTTTTTLRPTRSNPNASANIFTSKSQSIPKFQEVKVKSTKQTTTTIKPIATTLLKALLKSNMTDWHLTGKQTYEQVTVLPETTNTVLPRKRVPTNKHKVYLPIDKPNVTSTLAAAGKAKKEAVVETRILSEKATAIPGEGVTSTGAKITIVIVVLAMCSMAGLAVHAGLSSPRVRVALARLRGRRNRDPEVRYLSSDVDDD